MVINNQLTNFLYVSHWNFYQVHLSALFIYQDLQRKWLTGQVRNLTLSVSQMRLLRGVQLCPKKETPMQRN